MNTIKNRVRLFLGTCLLLPTFANAQDWSQQFELYGILASIDGETSMGRVTGAEIDVDFDAILENLEMAGMMHYEAHHKSGWGVSLDYGFMDLGSDISGRRGGVTDISVKQVIFEGLAIRRFQLEDGLLDYTVGVRWWDNEIDVSVDPAVLPGSFEVEIDEDWVDVVVGVRWLNNLNENWKFLLQGDVGGFGLESDFTGRVQVGALYQMKDKWVLDVKYIATWVDYENDETEGQPGYFAYDTVTHGPVIGVIYQF